jgi:hypothetical protein
MVIRERCGRSATVCRNRQVYRHDQRGVPNLRMNTFLPLPATAHWRPPHWNWQAGMLCENGMTHGRCTSCRKPPCAHAARIAAGPETCRASGNCRNRSCGTACSSPNCSFLFSFRDPVLDRAGSRRRAPPGFTGVRAFAACFLTPPVQYIYITLFHFSTCTGLRLTTGGVTARTKRTRRSSPIRIRPLTTDVAAAAITEAIGRGRGGVVWPAIHRIIFLLNALFPAQTVALMCRPAEPLITETRHPLFPAGAGCPRHVYRKRGSCTVLLTTYNTWRTRAFRRVWCDAFVNIHTLCLPMGRPDTTGKP